MSLWFCFSAPLSPPASTAPTALPSPPSRARVRTFPSIRPPSSVSRRCGREPKASPQSTPGACLAGREDEINPFFRPVSQRRRSLICILSAKAFHEKAGRSQVGSFVFRWTRFFLPAQLPTVATLPSALLDERFCFARCKLGVLVSAGAAT
jgi:hypothetical protein